MRSREQERLEGYLSRLFGYAMSLGNDREMARELVQDCALKALSARRVPRDEPAYRAWLFKILRHLFLDHCRRTANSAGQLQNGEQGAAYPEATPQDDRLISVITVRSGLGKLSDRHREIIALIDIGGFTYQETAEFLDLPVGTVMSRISRARARLLEIISDSNVYALPPARLRKDGR